MCSKSLIILLLGCALASAKPIQGNGNLTPQPGNNIDIGSWLNDAHYGIRKSFKHTVKPFAHIYDALVEASNVPKYSKEKIEELRILFHEIVDKSRENLNDIENAVLINTIVNLQKVIEFQSTRPSGFVQGPHQNIQTGQHVPHKGNQNLKEIIGNQANIANKIGHSVWSGFSGAGQTANNMGQKVQEMVNSQIENVKNGGFYDRSGVEITKKEENEKKKKATVDEDIGIFSNLGNTVQRAVDSGVENVKKNLDDWGNNWTAVLNAGQEFFNNFGGKVQETFNNGKNAIGSGIENVQGNLNEWGNKGFELSKGFNNIGNQAQDTFNNGLNGVQNQFNQYVPSSNNIGGEYEGTGHAFDSSQTLNNVGKQLAQGIATQMSEVEKSLYEWKSLVEGFLANSESNVEKQPRELHEGVNVLGSIEYMPNIGEGIEVQQNQKDGMFGKIGQKVGGNMGSGVDKFTGAVGGFYNNAEKLFG